MSGRAEAERAVVEGELLAEQMVYLYARAYLLQVHGQVERARGEAQAARERLTASLALFRRLGARKNAEHVECELADLTD